MYSTAQCYTVLYMSAPIMIRMSDDLVAQMDQARGDMNRSEWIRTLIVAHMDPGGTPEAKPSAPKPKHHVAPKAADRPTFFKEKTKK